jgi:hypothetical protein
MMPLGKIFNPLNNNIIPEICTKMHDFLTESLKKSGGVRGGGVVAPLPESDFFKNLSYKIVHFRAYFRNNSIIYSVKYFTKRHHWR